MEKLLFFGVYNRKVDGKNRLTIPSNFMQQLAKGKTVIVSKVSVLGRDILAVFPNIEVFDNNIASYIDMKIDINDVFFQRYVSSFSNSIIIDNASRIALKDMIVIPDDRVLTFVGKRDLFEIWRREDYIDYLDSNFDKLKSL